MLSWTKVSDRGRMEREEGREGGEREVVTERVREGRRKGKVIKFDGLACHHVSSDQLAQTV